MQKNCVSEAQITLSLQQSLRLLLLQPIVFMTWATIHLNSDPFCFLLAVRCNRAVICHSTWIYHYIFAAAEELPGLQPFYPCTR